MQTDNFVSSFAFFLVNIMGKFLFWMVLYNAQTEMSSPIKR